MVCHGQRSSTGVVVVVVADAVGEVGVDALVLVLVPALDCGAEELVDTRELVAGVAEEVVRGVLVDDGAAAGGGSGDWQAAKVSAAPMLRPAMTIVR